jgi:hypothetical protein
MTDLATLKSLGYIDQTIYANEETKGPWRNDEVIEMLREMRALIIADVEPALLDLNDLGDLAFGPVSTAPDVRREDEK